MMLLEVVMFDQMIWGTAAVLARALIPCSLTATGEN
jgi:hypothetical protein